MTRPATKILNDEEILRRRDKNSFDAGFSAGLQCVQETHSELLEALKEAERFIDRHSEEWYTTGQELLAKMRAAIAKAEGQR